MAIYSPEMTLRDARSQYFALNNFGADGGYEDRWIKVKVWRVPIWIPNTEGRRRAVPLHDIHHILTEYPTTWRGEAEISTWEIASGGLHQFYAGWLLDLLNVAQGLLINPRGVYGAFMRGRSNSNLYLREFSEHLLNQRVGEMRRRVGLERACARVTLRDLTAFIFWAGAGVITYLATVSVLVSPLVLFVLASLWLRA